MNSKDRQVHWSNRVNWNKTVQKGGKCRMLKGYCAVFQHALKSMKIKLLVFYLKECRKLQKKIPKGYKVIRNLNFN